MTSVPMLRPLLGLIIGIIISEHLSLPPRLTPILLPLLGSLLILALLTLRRPHLFTITLWILFPSLGVLTHLSSTPRDPFPKGVPDQLIVQLRDNPRRTPKCQKSTAEILAAHDSLGWHSCDAKILVYIQYDSLSATLQHGSALWLHTQPRKPDTALNPHQSDYRRHLRRQGILYQAYVPSGRWHPFPVPPPRGLRHHAQQIQHTLLARLRATTLTAEHQGLVAALALGYRDDIPPATKLRFQQSGITHLLCVSGLHVGIVAQLVSIPLLFLGQKPRQRLLKGTLQLLAVWSFALISGLAPATLRAALMFSLIIIGRNLGRQYYAPNSLCSSAVVLLLINPFLLFDVGFQLSYAAMAGILLWHHPLRQSLPASPSPMRNAKLAIPAYLLRKLWGWVALSLAAQVATLPLILFYFHQFPTYFLIANLLIVPFMELILGTAFLAILFGGGIATFLQALLEAIDSLTAWIASRPHALIQDIYCDIPLVLILFAMLIFLTFLIRRRWRWALPAALITLFAATAYIAHVDAMARRQHAVVLYDAGRSLAIECLDGRHSYLICDDSVARHPDIIDYQRRGLLLHQRVNASTVLPIDTSFFDGCCAVRNHCILFDGRRLLVIDSANAGHLVRRQEGAVRGEKVRRLHFDAVIIAPQVRFDTSLMSSVVSCDTLLSHYGCTVL